MRPILLQGHTRSLTQIRYNRDGDLLYTVSKDKVVNVWYSHNGERLGTFHGHEGTVWTVDVNASTTLVATGSADNTARLWNAQTGECLVVQNFDTAVKRIEFSEDGSMLLCVTEERMGFTGTITVLAIDQDAMSLKEVVVLKNEINNDTAGWANQKAPKAMVAGWSYLDKYIISGHADGSICQWDWKNKTKLRELKAKDKGHSEVINDMQFDKERMCVMTASKDKTAKLFDVDTLTERASYSADTPLNSASITPAFNDFVILGGGQDAMNVTTTSAKQGKFESRFYHKILTTEVGRVRGHFGPINTIAVHPDGKSYSSGGEDGYVRVHHFDSDYFKYKVTI